MEQKPSKGGDSLPWMTTDKLLELVAHDINNMCHATLSYIDLALDPSQGPEARAKFLTTAKVMAHRASRFAPHLRAMNELRGAELSAAPSAPIAKAASEAKVKASELNMGAPLSLSTSGDGLESRVKGGPHLTAVLTHLFDNAIRFQKPGGKAVVSLDAHRDGDQLVLTVKDNGRGFAKGAELYASKRFTAPGSVSGAGLGLAYVRLFAERSGGTLTLSGKPDGAEIRLRVPVAPEA